MHRLALALLAVALVSLAGTPALAHFDGADRYTHATCPASAANRVDPINVVFTSWGTWGRAESQVESHAGWTATSGSTQSFGEHGSCSPLHTQRASGNGSRFHVRLRGQHPDATLGWTALAAAHHEDVVVFPLPCGHASRCERSGRERLRPGSRRAREAIRKRRPRLLSRVVGKHAELQAMRW